MKQYSPIYCWTVCNVYLYRSGKLISKWSILNKSVSFCFCFCTRKLLLVFFLDWLYPVLGEVVKHNTTMVGIGQGLINILIHLYIVVQKVFVVFLSNSSLINTYVFTMCDKLDLSSEPSSALPVRVIYKQKLRQIINRHDKKSSVQANTSIINKC